MNERDGDFVMAGLIAGFLLFAWAVASCCRFPRGPERCVESSTLWVDARNTDVGIGAPAPPSFAVEMPSDAGSDP